MPDATPPNPPAPQNFRIGEEFGTAKKNLPPLKIVAVGIAVIALAWAIAAFVQRPQSAARGEIDEVVSAEIPNQHAVIVAINIAFQNNGAKPFFIRSLKADLETAGNIFSADAASAVDLDRYYRAFPALKQYAETPIQREARLDPGGQAKGTMVVSFPVSPEDFAKRKSLRVTIQPYDQPVPLVLSK